MTTKQEWQWEVELARAAAEDGDECKAAMHRSMANELWWKMQKEE